MKRRDNKSVKMITSILAVVCIIFTVTNYVIISRINQNGHDSKGRQERELEVQSDLNGHLRDDNIENDNIEIKASDCNDVQQASISVSSTENKKIYNWGFKKLKNSQPEVIGEIVEVLKTYGGCYIGDISRKVMYLTFDLGYENGYTAKILDELKAENIKATFFLTGHYFNTNKDLIRRIIEEGHELGNHTVHHPNLAKIESSEKIKEEIMNLHNSVKSEFGVEMKSFRPPAGTFSEKSLNITKECGYRTVFWSAAYLDWDVNKQNGTDFAYEKITSQFHNGALFLLHAVSKDNANSLRRVIQTSKEQGYQFDLARNI